MGNLSARVDRLEMRVPLAAVGAAGTQDQLQAMADFRPEFERRMAGWKAEDARRALLPLEEQIALLKADYEAKIAARVHQKTTITSEFMNAVSDRFCRFGLAALAQKIRERDGAAMRKLPEATSLAERLRENRVDVWPSLPANPRTLETE